jgi:hypothetical protein
MPTGEITANELKPLCPSIEGDIVFTVRGLTDRELFGIRAVSDDSTSLHAFRDFGRRPPSADEDPDLKYFLEIVQAGSINPRVDVFLAGQLARDFHVVLRRVSEKILELSADGAQLNNLSALYRLQ